MSRSLEEWVLRWFPTLGRILMSLIFIDAGLNGMGHFDEAVASAAAAAVPMPESMVLIFIIMSLSGGLLFLIGFKAREAAMVLSTAVILFTLFFNLNIFDKVEGELQLTLLLRNAAILGGLFYVIAFGAGKLSFDLIGEDERIRKLTTSTM